jgi:hypothetical protein
MNNLPVYWLQSRVADDIVEVVDVDICPCFNALYLLHVLKLTIHRHEFTINIIINGIARITVTVVKSLKLPLLELA